MKLFYWKTKGRDLVVLSNSTRRKIETRRDYNPGPIGIYITPISECHSMFLNPNAGIVTQQAIRRLIE